MRLASVSDPSKRDVKVWNSQVLDRIDVDLLGKVSHGRRSPDLDRFGYTCPEKNGNDQILEKIGIPNLGMALTRSHRALVPSKIFNPYIIYVKYVHSYTQAVLS